MSGMPEPWSQRGRNDDDTSQYGTFHDRLIRSKRYYDNVTIGTNYMWDWAADVLKPGT